MRDKLIELLKLPSNCMPYAKCESCGLNGGCSVQRQADKLLANGVIVPPCKVGDVVYEALPKVGHIRSNTVMGFRLGKFPDIRGHKRKEYLICYSDYSLTHIDIEKFGKTVFLSREEAEKALKGGEG